MTRNEDSPTRKATVATAEEQKLALAEYTGEAVKKWTGGKGSDDADQATVDNALRAEAADALTGGTLYAEWTGRRPIIGVERKPPTADELSDWAHLKNSHLVAEAHLGDRATGDPIADITTFNRHLDSSIIAAREELLDRPLTDVEAAIVRSDVRNARLVNFTPKVEGTLSSAGSFGSGSSTDSSATPGAAPDSGTASATVRDAAAAAKAAASSGIATNSPTARTQPAVSDDATPATTASSTVETGTSPPPAYETGDTSVDDGGTEPVPFTREVWLTEGGASWYNTAGGQWFDASGNEVTDAGAVAALNALADHMGLPNDGPPLGEVVPSGESYEDVAASQSPDGSATDSDGDSSSDSDDDSGSDSDSDDDTDDGSDDGGDDDDDDDDDDSDDDDDEETKETTDDGGDDTEEDEDDSGSGGDEGTPTPDHYVVDEQAQAAFLDSAVGRTQRSQNETAIDMGRGGGLVDPVDGEEGGSGDGGGIGVVRGDIDPHDLESRSAGGPVDELTLIGGGVVDPVDDGFGSGAPGATPLSPGGGVAPGGGLRPSVAFERDDDDPDDPGDDASGMADLSDPQASDLEPDVATIADLTVNVDLADVSSAIDVESLDDLDGDT